MNKLRAGNILIRISNIFYEVPDVFLFKSPKGDDCYLSGVNYIKNGFKDESTCVIKYIVEDTFKTLPFIIVEKYLLNEYKKLLFYDEEYDIPLNILGEIKYEFKNIKKYDVKSKKDFLSKYSKYKSNK